jgi:hypothetical protein
VVCEFVEGEADTIVDGQVDGELVVAAPQVLHERVPAKIVRAEASRFSPRIGRNRAFSRP